MLMVFATIGLLFFSSCEKDKPKTDYATLEELSLDASGYYNGSDMAGGFSSGNVSFSTKYDPDYMAWNGFAYTNHSNDSTGDYSNQYSSITGSGADGSEKYAVMFTYSQDTISFLVPEKVTNISFCNTTYAFKTMRNGNAYAKKFGGADGNDPDYFRLIVKGYDENDVIKVNLTLNLADYTDDDNSNDYISNLWTDVDLSDYGFMQYLVLSFESSDTGIYGINTPTYVCIDNIYGELMD